MKKITLNFVLTLVILFSYHSVNSQTTTLLYDDIPAGSISTWTYHNGDPCQGIRTYEEVVSPFDNTTAIQATMIRTCGSYCGSFSMTKGYGFSNAIDRTTAVISFDATFDLLGSISHNRSYLYFLFYKEGTFLQSVYYGYDRFGQAYNVPSGMLASGNWSFNITSLADDPDSLVVGMHVRACVAGDGRATWDNIKVEGSYVSGCNDVDPPVVITKDITVQLNAAGTVSISADDVNNGSYDDCGIASISVSPSTFDCSDAGENTVTLTVTDNNGNVETKTAIVTVEYNNMLTATISSSANTNGTVIGGTITYADDNQMFIGYGPQSMNITCTPSGGSSFTYYWTGSGLSDATIANPIFTPTQEGNYTLTCTVTNNFGCETTESITICVINAKGGNAKNPKVLICHKPAGNSNNAQNISVSANSVTSHLGKHGGCTLGACGSSCSSLINSFKVGGETLLEGEIDDKSTNSVIVYPNPNNGKFGLDVFSENDGMMSISVYDMFGKEIYTIDNQELSGFTYVPISLDGVRRAQYFVRVTIDGKVFTTAVLVNP